jgi:hypothetical protein
VNRASPVLSRCCFARAAVSPLPHAFIAHRARTFIVHQFEIVHQEAETVNQCYLGRGQKLGVARPRFIFELPVPQLSLNNRSTNDLSQALRSFMQARRGNVVRHSSNEKAGRFEPMQLLRSGELADGPGWLRELKLDGYRDVSFNSAGKIHVRSRDDNDFKCEIPGCCRGALRYAERSWGRTNCEQVEMCSRSFIS